MCGIFAYLNHEVAVDRKFILATLVNGLKRLEYRGYDSAGIACDGDGSEPSHVVVKKVGKVSNLEAACLDIALDKEATIRNHSGIAHTRWATHGSPSEKNSHPQLSNETAEFCVVHNGIITNCNALRAFLERKGYNHISDTDTESIAKLLQYLYDTKKANGEEPDFLELVEDAASQLEGAFAIVIKSTNFPNELVAMRRGSPLLVGIKQDLNQSVRVLPSIIPVRKINTKESAPNTPAKGPQSSAERVGSISEFGVGEPVEYFFASDASAIIEHTKKIVFLEDDDVAYVQDGRLNIHRTKVRHGAPQTRDIMTVEVELNEIMKGQFDHFMMKEIFEQPDSVTNTMRGRLKQDENAEAKVMLGGLKDHIDSIKRCRRLLFIACGTSYNSALACRQWLEETTQLPVIVDIASDFMDRDVPIFRDDVCFFISQSGETADTLAALRYCKNRGALIVGITNTVGSSISRESDCGVHVNAGPEIGVASTKAYTSQVLVLLLFGLMMSEDRVSMISRRKEVIGALQSLPEKIREVLELDAQIKEMATTFENKSSILVLGRGYAYANCLEGALKIKELTYIHSEGILAGELKHGPLALVEPDMPIIMLISKDHSYDKSINALEQITARGGKPIVICPKGEVPVLSASKVQFQTIEVPKIVDCVQSILSVIPMQLLSYHIACNKGLDVDCPRNLAKSVTVE